MDKAREQAEKVKPEDRMSEIERNLLEATENNKKASEQLEKEMSKAKAAINETVENAGLNNYDQQKLMNTVQQVYALLERAKSGENVIDQLNKLRL